MPIDGYTQGADWGYSTAWLFFATCTVVTVLVWFHAPKPSQRNYAEIGEMYRKRVPPRKIREYVSEVQLTQQQRLAEIGKL